MPYKSRRIGFCSGTLKFTATIRVNSPPLAAAALCA
jgi:hypothetical protein